MISQFYSIKKPHAKILINMTQILDSKFYQQKLNQTLKDLIHYQQRKLNCLKQDKIIEFIFIIY